MVRLRVQLQPAYVLHWRPWSETSLLVDVFSLRHGRFRVLAKGARRQKTGHRGELLPFQLLSISWSGKQLPTLTSVEISEVRPSIRRTALACGYYMNELLFKLLHRDDPHEALFYAYDDAMLALSSGQDPETVLRLFECELLQEVGFGLQLEVEARSGLAIESDTQYYYYPELGPVKASSATEQAPGFSISGETLLQLADKQLTTPVAKNESKRLIRQLMSRFLRGERVRSRQVFEKMVAYQRQQ